MRVEQTRGCVLEMSSASVHLPRLRFRHPPQLHKTVVSRGDDQWQSRMKRNPVHAPIVPLENEFDDRIRVSKHVCLVLVGACHLVFERHGLRRRVLLPQPRDVPNANRLIERGGNDKVLLRVELSAHGVMVMASHRTLDQGVRSQCMSRMQFGHRSPYNQ
jgi:hypothetical protein